MYYLFKDKNMLPHQYYNLNEGEKMILAAFFEFDMEQREEIQEEIRKNEIIRRLLAKN